MRRMKLKEGEGGQRLEIKGSWRRLRQHLISILRSRDIGSKCVPAAQHVGMSMGILSAFERKIVVDLLTAATSIHYPYSQSLRSLNSDLTQINPASSTISRLAFLIQFCSSNKQPKKKTFPWA